MFEFCCVEWWVWVFCVGGKSCCDPITFSTRVNIYSPFFEDPIVGTVVQLEEGNIVLVHVEKTGKIGGFFGTDLVVKEVSV